MKGRNNTQYLSETAFGAFNVVPKSKYS